MMDKEMDNVLMGIDSIVQKLLIPARTEKTIDRDAFDLFYFYLDKILELVQEKEMIPRRVAGLLFFIYTSLSGDVQNKDYRNPVFMEVAKLEGYLSKIYWDSPFIDR